MKSRRKFLAAEGRLVQEIIKVANKNGKTVYSFINEILELVLEAEKMGVPLKEIIEYYKLADIERKSGGITTRKDIMNYLISKVYPAEKDEMLKKWYESGLWYGTYLLIKFEKEKSIEMLQKLFRTLAWGISDITISAEEDRLHLRCTAPEHQTVEETELFSKFLEGAIHSLGYETTKRKILKGLILLDCKQT